jgi:DNA protecting protein DprA
MSENVAILQLMHTRGVGSRTLARVLSNLAREQRSPTDLLGAAEEDLVQYGLKPESAAALAAARSRAEQTADDLERQGIRVLIRGAPDYPTRLSRILGDQAPPVLFVAGNASLLDHKAVAFSGARDASAEGLRLTQRLAHGLAEQGVTIVSGHANGVDLTAHGAALAAGGTTVLVLAEGILRFRAKPVLAGWMRDDNIAVVSEFPPRLPWSVGNAMQRNATVCGLADVVIVIEAGLTGGTLAAGQKALELGQPLFVAAFPHPPTSAAGNAILLRQGGQPLPPESDGEVDLSHVLQQLERTGETGVARGKSGGRPAIIQRGLFVDNEGVK